MSGRMLSHSEEEILKGHSLLVSHAAPSRWKVMAVLILLLGMTVFFLRLGGYVLLDPDEGRYAEIAREMIESGDFITPHLNYIPYLEKPPFYYWVTAASLAVLGENEWAVRVVPALAGFFTLALVMGMGWRHFGPKIGLTAAWVYLTSLLPSALARLAIVDTLFTFCLTAAWAGWWMGSGAAPRRVRRQWYVVAWGFLALATMTKGPVALVLSLLIVGIFVGVRRDWPTLRETFWWPGLLLFAILVLPWHLAVGMSNPDFWHFYIVVQHLDRALGEEHVKPFWYFPAILPLGIGFWGIFLFPIAARALRLTYRAVRTYLGGAGRNPNAGAVLTEADKGACPGQPHSILYLSIWVVSVVGLFSLSAGKLATYILPAYPPLALLTAWHLQTGGLERPSARWCLGFTSLLLLGLFIALPYAARMEEAVPFSELTAPLLAGQAAVALGALLSAAAIFRRRFAPLAVGLAALILMPSAFMTVQQVAKYRKVGGLVKALPDLQRKEIKIAEWRTYDRSLGFYLRRGVILVDEVSELRPEHATRDERARLLKGEGSLKSLAEQGPLLVNMRPSDWPAVRSWKIFYPVAANSRHIMLANESFLKLTRLRPWPEESVGPGPLLLMPRRENAPAGRLALGSAEVTAGSWEPKGSGSRK
jgi:4-amino-4-deoxy-L-arabinose transferase-like glycosyltransferase